MKKTCKQCGKEFELTSGEIKFYKSKNLNLPSRCKECREENKKNKAAESSVTTDTVSSASTGTANKKSNGKTYGILGSVLAVIIGLFIFFFGGNNGPSTDSGTTTTTPSVSQSTTTTADKKDEVTTPQSSQTTAQTTTQTTTSATTTTTEEYEIKYTFRNQKLLDQHYEKHGIEMGFDSAEDYMIAANKVIEASGVLHKLEAEDGDDVYFLPETEEFVVVSTDGYIRTYYNADLDYFNRQ